MADNLRDWSHPLSSQIFNNSLSTITTTSSPTRLANMKDIIKTLIHNPDQFSPNDATIAINAIMQGSATHSQVSAFLIALRLQQKDQDPAIVAACAQAMQSHARLIPYNHYEHLEGNVVDIVGTGGDGHDTYNVSTTASIVAAGAGAKVAKVCPNQRLYQQASFNNTLIYSMVIVQHHQNQDQQILWKHTDVILAKLNHIKCLIYSTRPTSASSFHKLIIQP